MESFDIKAASCVPGTSLFTCLGILYLLDSAVIHIPFYEDFEFVTLFAVFAFISGLYTAKTSSYYFVAATLSGLTAFLILRAVFLYQQFLNRCDARSGICAMALSFRLSTSLTLFLTLVPCAGLYGAAVYVFMDTQKAPVAAVTGSPVSMVVVGQPTEPPMKPDNTGQVSVV
jgi:hypothetical protein